MPRLTRRSLLDGAKLSERFVGRFGTTVGEQARQLFADGRALLDRIVAEKWLRAAAVVGLFPANAVGDR